MGSDSEHKDLDFSDLGNLDRDEKGGFNSVEGWNSNEWKSIREFMKDAFTADTVDDVIENPQELLEIVLGEGEYSDSHSYPFTTDDIKDMREEGFFQPFYCHQCLEELPEKEVKDDIDPTVRFKVIGPYSQRSFRPDYEKKGLALWYTCKEHSEVSMGWETTWYEEEKE